MGAIATFSSIPNYPATVNTPKHAQLCAQAAEKVVGKENVLRNEKPSMGSEDFSFSKQTISLQDLEGIPFVGIEGPLSEKLYSYFSKKKFIPNFITKTDSYLMAASYVKKGLGISVLDQISASSLNSSDFIWNLKEAPSCNVYLVIPKNITKSHIQENFISFVINHNYKL